MPLGVLSLSNAGMSRWNRATSSGVSVAMCAWWTREVLEFASVPVGTTTCPVGPTASPSAETTVLAPPATRPSDRSEACTSKAWPGSIPSLRRGRTDLIVTLAWLRMAYLRLPLSLPCLPAPGSPSFRGRRRRVRYPLPEPRFDGGAHAFDEAGAERRQRARSCQCLDRLRGHRPPPGEQLGRRERVGPRFHVAPHPPVVSDGDVRVRALQQGAERPRVLPPGSEEQPLVLSVAQVEHVG